MSSAASNGRLAEAAAEAIRGVGFGRRPFYELNCAASILAPVFRDACRGRHRFCNRLRCFDGLLSVVVLMP